MFLVHIIIIYTNITVRTLNNIIYVLYFIIFTFRKHSNVARNGAFEINDKQTVLLLLFFFFFVTL